MTITHGGALARLVAGGVAAATAVAGFTVGLAAPAHAAPVGVTTTLTDPAGNGLDGYVTAYALQGDGSYDYAAEAVVADGLVAINVEPGTYKFWFADEDRVFTGEYYNDKLTFEAADPVAVAGATALAPVALTPRTTIGGQVVSPSGKPIEDASVQVYNADDTYETSARTKADGTWAVGVDAGSYKTYFSASGYASEYYNNKPTLTSADAVAAGTGLGVVTLTEGSVVQGTITNLAGAPLERARATLYSPTGGYIASDLSDAAGTYRIDGVPPGGYRIQFTDPVGEYLSEWNADKADRETADPVDVPVDAVVLVGAALAPDPAAAVDPAKVDVSGVVTDSSGAPVIGADVIAYDTPGDSDKPAPSDAVRSNRAGQYFFSRLSETSETTFKVQAVDSLEREEGQYERLDRWYGGAQTYEVAAPVGKPAGGVNVMLPLTGGISGAITSESGLPVDSTGVRFFDEKGNPANETGASAEEDGTYLSTNLVPGTYKVQFIDTAAFYDPFGGGGDVRAHAPEWYDNTSFAKAKTITVKSGATVTGINAALSQDLRTFRKPEINGQPYLGKKVRAYPGVWSLESGTTYSYEWLVGDAVVGTGSSYRVTKAAKNKRITLRVTAENGVLNGTALTSSQVIKKKPKVKVSVKGAKASVSVKAKKVKAKKFKGKVIVKKIVREDEYGAPVYKKIGKAKLRNGKASLKLKKLSKGKNKLVFQITLKGGKYGNAEVAKTVKVKRKR